MGRPSTSNPQAENYARWIEEAKRRGARYILDVCDTFDYDHYPVYIMTEEELPQKRREYDEKPMQQVFTTIVVPQKFKPKGRNRGSAGAAVKS